MRRSLVLTIPRKVSVPCPHLSFSTADNADTNTFPAAFNWGGRNATEVFDAIAIFLSITGRVCVRGREGLREFAKDNSKARINY